MTSSQLRVAVVGAGIMGASAAWRLAEHGAQVDVFDASHLGNPAGSSAGETRMFRRTYAEGDEYEPLLARSLDLWNDLSIGAFARVLEPGGGVIIAQGAHPLLTRTRAYAERFGLPYAALSPDKARRRFPHITCSDDETILVDPAAGTIRSSIAVVQAMRRAEQLGARLHERTRVSAVSENTSGVSLDLVSLTDGATRSARYDRVVIATGVAAPELLDGLEFIDRWFVHTWHPRADRSSRPLPITMRRGVHNYGAMDALDGSTLKLSPHYFENRLDAAGGLDALHDRAHEISAQASALVREAFVGIDPAVVRMQFFTESYTPDGHPYVGVRGRTAILAGFSGHGFKIAPGLADAVAREALELPVAPLPDVVSVDRPRTAEVDIRSAGLDDPERTA